MLPVPRPLTALAALLSAAALVAISAPPAFAHARLVGSTPTEGEVVDAMPTTITLEFNERVEADFGQLQVSGPHGERLDQTPPSAQGSTVTSEIAAPTSAGTHTVAFRILSADGHPVEAEFTFEVTDAAIAAAAEPAEGDADPAAEESADAPRPDATPADETAGDPGETDETDETDETGETGETDEAADLDDAEALAADGDGGAPILPIAVVLLVALGVGGALFARRRGADTETPPGT